MNPIRWAAAVAAACITAILIVAYSVTHSGSTVIKDDGVEFEIRLSGLSPKAWFDNELVFTDERIAGFSARPTVTVSNRKGDPSIPISYELNGRHFSGKVAGTVPLRAVADGTTVAGSGSGVEARVKVESSKNTLKLESIVIRPRFLFLLPTWQFGRAPLIAVFSLLCLGMLASWSFKTHTFNPLLPAALAVFLARMLSTNPLEYWVRGVWLSIFLAAGLIGVTIYRALDAARGDQPVERAPLDVRGAGIAAGAIFLLALVIRLNGLNFGLPAFFHPDEARKSKIARHIVESGDINPHYFRHPSFVVYSTAAMSAAQRVITGEVPPLDRVLLLGRLVSAVLGSLSVYILYLIGSALYDKRAGLIAALVLAGAPLHVVSSRYIKEDASLVFFTLLCCYTVIRALKAEGDSRWRLTLLAGFFGGMSASAKYSGLLNLSLVSAPLVVRLLDTLNSVLPPKWRRPWEFSLKDAEIFRVFFATVAAYSAFAIGFLLITPFSLLDTQKFLTDFNGEAAHMEKGHTLAISAMSYYWMFHFKFSVVPGMTLFTALLAVVACGYLVARGKLADLMILSLILVFYLPAEYVKAKPMPQPERYILPCLPFLALALGKLLTDSLAALRSNAVRASATAALLAACVIPSTLFSVQHALTFRTDTRIQATEWIESHLPHGSTIFVEWKIYGPPRLPKNYTVRELKFPPDKKYLRNLSPDEMREAGGDYLVISSFFYERYLNPLFRAHPLKARYEAIFANKKPLAVFSNPEYNYGFHNPTIMVFSLEPDK